MMNSCLSLLIRIYYSSSNNRPSTLTVSYMPEISLLIFIDMQNLNWWQLENNPVLGAPNFPLKMSVVILAGDSGEQRQWSKGGPVHEMQMKPFSSLFAFFRLCSSKRCASEVDIVTSDFHAPQRQSFLKFLAVMAQRPWKDF